jgi:hypothetical protein
VIVALGEKITDLNPSMYAMRVFDTREGLSTRELFETNNIDFNVTDHNNYDVFSLRKLMEERPVDVAIWPMPPFHMFFLFSFGLAAKQVWLSQYLRSNIKFKYLDDRITLGGAGTIRKKVFNNQEWDIVPQIVNTDALSLEKKRESKRKILFTPARLEKLKQPEFLNCVARILKIDRKAHFLWTGYYLDEEVVDFFKKNNLTSRHTYLPWLSSKDLSIQIKQSSIILSCFPLSLGTVENTAASHGVPIVSMYDEEFNLYWRDIYWEAINGNEMLREICLNENGESKILIARTEDEYVEVALKVLNDKNLAKVYADTYQKAHEYTYIKNENDIGGILRDFLKI